jgi:hypothetical protein
MGTWKQRPLFRIALFGFLLIFSAIIAGGFSRFYQIIARDRFLNSELRVAAEWLNSNIKHNSLVYTYQPWVFDYYTHNPYITYIYNNSVHLFEKNLKTSDADVLLLLQDHYDVNNLYLDTANGIELYRLLYDRIGTYPFKKIHTVTSFGRQISIYIHKGRAQ